jgi:hypothetical protein
MHQRAFFVLLALLGVQIGDPGLAYTKIDPLMDPIRQEPRFQAVEGQLRFPN